MMYNTTRTSTSRAIGYEALKGNKKKKRKPNKKESRKKNQHDIVRTLFDPFRRPVPCVRIYLYYSKRTENPKKKLCTLVISVTRKYRLRRVAALRIVRWPNLTPRTKGPTALDARAYTSSCVEGRRVRLFFSCIPTIFLTRVKNNTGRCVYTPSLFRACS